MFCVLSFLLCPCGHFTQGLGGQLERRYEGMGGGIVRGLIHDGLAAVVRPEGELHRVFCVHACLLIMSGSALVGEGSAYFSLCYMSFFGQSLDSLCEECLNESCFEPHDLMFCSLISCPAMLLVQPIPRLYFDSL